MAGETEQGNVQQQQVTSFEDIFWRSTDHLEPVNQPRIDEVSTTYEDAQKAAFSLATSAARDVVVGMGEMTGRVVRIDTVSDNNIGQAGSTTNLAAETEAFQQKARVKITSHGINQQTALINPKRPDEHFLLEQYHVFVADPGIPQLQLFDEVGVIFGDNVAGAHGKIVRVYTAGPDRRVGMAGGGTPPAAQGGFGWGGYNCGQAVNTPANQTRQQSAGTSPSGVKFSEAVKQIPAPSGVFKPSTGANKRCLIVGDDHVIGNIGKTWEAYYKYNGWEVMRLGVEKSSLANWAKGESVGGKDLKALLKKGADFKPAMLLVKLGGNGGFGQGADPATIMNSGVQNVNGFINKIKEKSPGLKTYWLGIYFNPADEKKSVKARKAAQVLADQANIVFAALMGSVTYIDGAARHNELTPSYPHHKSHPEQKVALELVANWVRIIDANEKGAPFKASKPVVNKAKEVKEKTQKEAAAQAALGAVIGTAAATAATGGKALPKFSKEGGTPLTDEQFEALTEEEKKEIIELAAKAGEAAATAVIAAATAEKAVHVQTQPTVTCTQGAGGWGQGAGAGAGGHPSGFSGGSGSPPAKMRGPKMGRKDGHPVTQYAMDVNMKYFGNAAGNGPRTLKGKTWSSSANHGRKHGMLAGSVLGHIPYLPGVYTTEKMRLVKKYCKKAYAQNNTIKSCEMRGTVRTRKKKSTKYPGDRGGKIRMGWALEFIKRVDLNLENKNNPKLHKICHPFFVAAVKECQGRFGIPLTTSGGYVPKGTPGGWSAHAHGTAIDFDSLVTPFTRGGMLDLSRVKSIANDKGGHYKRYWNLRSRTGQTFKNYIDGAKARKEKAVSLYEFIAGPYNDSEIGKIFAKYGIKWGAHFSFKNPKARKDTMHFEWSPPSSMKGAVLQVMAGGKINIGDPSKYEQVVAKEQTQTIGASEGGDQLSQSQSTETQMSTEPG